MNYPVNSITISPSLMISIIIVSVLRTSPTPNVTPLKIINIKITSR